MSGRSVFSSRWQPAAWNAALLSLWHWPWPSLRGRGKFVSAFWLPPGQACLWEKTGGPCSLGRLRKSHIKMSSFRFPNFKTRAKLSGGNAIEMSTLQVLCQHLSRWWQAPIRTGSHAANSAAFFPHFCPICYSSQIPDDLWKFLMEETSNKQILETQVQYRSINDQIYLISYSYTQNTIFSHFPSMFL